MAAQRQIEVLTMGGKALALALACMEALAGFRFFYNQVRPHQNVVGRTPAEA